MSSETKFGEYGGQYVPEALMPAIEELTDAYERYVLDNEDGFVDEFRERLGQFGGRPSNWSPKRVNDRLRRSREGRPNYDSHDVVWTIAGVVDATRIRAFRLLEENNIILQS